MTTTTTAGVQSGHAAIARATSQTDETSKLIAAKCRALLKGYDRRFSHSDYAPLKVEYVRTADLFNPDTQHRSRSFQLAGVLDILAERNGRRVLFDHKSTSQDITDPDGPFWRQLSIEGQVSHYLLLEWLNGEKVDEAVWDVMRKPSISPKKLSASDRRATVATRRYFDCELSQQSLDSLQVDERETLEMYEARLAHDCCTERPEWYFQRRTIPRLDADIIEYAREAWEHGQEILHVRRTERHARNSGACLLYGSPCKFLGICSGFDTPKSDKWHKKAWVHPEIPPQEGDGRNLLTNSRIRCFQTCRRKEYYEYNLGIERIDAEDREALVFGSAWHIALAAWWSSFLKEPDSGYCNESAGNELANPSGADEEAFVG